MKNLLFKKTNQMASLLSLSLLALLITVADPSNAKTSCTRKMVLYKGEWITRVDMPEVTIKANRMEHRNQLLKNVETVYHRGLKTLHITTEDIVISASGNTGSRNDIKANQEIESMQSFSGYKCTSTMISAGIYDNIALSGPENTKQDEMTAGLTADSKSGVELTKVKKPFFSRLANSILDAGFDFLKKINDGLFFKS
jgi:hypothetical protein